MRNLIILVIAVVLLIPLNVCILLLSSTYLGMLPELGNIITLVVNMVVIMRVVNALP